ncbi:MAG: hypothetical protein ACRDVE_03115 [Actinocrinis sp.]
MREPGESYISVAAGLATVRVPSREPTVPSDDAFIQITAAFGADDRAAWAWAANVLRWLLDGGSFNPDGALGLYGCPER